jgi:hypothetical protein
MGKAALLMVMGFSTALLMIGSNISRVSSSSMENYLSYYKGSQAHNIAAAGTNLAARLLWENGAWRGGFSKKSYLGGVFNSSVTDAGINQVRITTTARFMDEVSTVAVLLQPSSFSRFGYYSVQEGNIFWITGDTVWGPMHTQDNIRVAGSPVFMQRVTSLKSLQKNQKSDSPKFLGGFDSGVNVPLPANLDPLKSAASNGGRLFNGPDSLYLDFQANGQIKWKQGSGETWNTENLSNFTPNGAIYIDGGNVHVKGCLNGRVTVGAGGTTGSNKQGNIYIDDDITYYEHPKKGSDDLLGLVAENNIVIADKPETRGDLSIRASMFCRSGGLTAENYQNRPVEGAIHLIGGIQHNKRGPVGTFTGSPPHRVSGFLKDYQYDDRLMFDAPPYFPTTGNFEIVSWFE